jgi:hypothetical protein
MALPPAEGIAQAVFNYRQDGQEVKNVIHFGQTAPISTGTLQQLAEDCEGWWRTFLRILQVSTLTLPSITIRDLGATPENPIFRIVGAPQAGTQAPPGAPNSVTIVLSMRTALAGRSFRGRIYHLGLPNAQIAVNAVQPTHVTALIAAYAELLNFPVGPGETPWVPGVLSYYSGGALRPTPVFTPAVVFTSDGVIDSQRRRLPGRGA